VQDGGENEQCINCSMHKTARLQLTRKGSYRNKLNWLRIWCSVNLLQSRV